MEAINKPPLSREELVKLVRTIIDWEGSEEERSELLFILKNSTPHPSISDLIFYPPKGKEDMTPEEIVDEALNYKPIILP